ncbi:Uncharacterized protein HZ326_23354 [Fusarium oxysporum f. sp. albedinis]|nr:Uncharacterized protein HZ326_23354 [Fusarium oxysporum f. sp. albedinis]
MGNLDEEENSSALHSQPKPEAAWPSDQSHGPSGCCEENQGSQKKDQRLIAIINHARSHWRQRILWQPQ